MQSKAGKGSTFTVTLLEGTTLPGLAKVLSLGLALMNSVGEEVLTAAVKTLGNEIKTRQRR